jgi:hypothetical protein
MQTPDEPSRKTSDLFQEDEAVDRLLGSGANRVELNLPAGKALKSVAEMTSEEIKQVSSRIFSVVRARAAAVGAKPVVEKKPSRHNEIDISR